MNQQAIDRLQLKSAAEAIIERIQHDFNLAPMVARTLFKQMRSYFESYYQLKNDTGQLTYLAVSADSPAGRKLEECQRVAIKLSLHTPDDLVALSRGIAALRQARILRLTEEAIVLNKGQLIMRGPSQQAVDFYLSSGQAQAGEASSWGWRSLSTPS